MNHLIALPLLLLLAYFSLVLQELLPALQAFGGARIQLVPTIFCIGALILNFPLMLILAFACGILFDLMQLQFVDGHAEIAMGTTVLIFLLFGSVCQGLRTLFLEGKWWIASIISSLATAALLATQFLLLSLKRMEGGGWMWAEEILWRIFFPAFVAFLLAPVFLLLFHYVGAGLFHGRRDSVYP